MRLYHGTTEAVARAALAQGLAPRSATQVSGNWDKHPSNANAVYLTTAYAGYFAACAAETGKWGLVEVETDLLDATWLVPDEDWLEQVSRTQVVKGMRAKTVAGRTRWLRDRLILFRGHWLDSIGGLGNCAYLDEIPASAVTRVCVFDPKSNQAMAMHALDPCISLMNYAFCGEKYRNLLRWFFDGDVSPGELFFGLESVFNPDPARLRQAQGILAERGGIEVLTAGAASATRRTPWSEGHDARAADSGRAAGVAGP